jgi:hypothetical protein
MAIAALRHADNIKRALKNTSGPRDEEIEACPGDCHGDRCRRCWRDR